MQRLVAPRPRQVAWISLPDYTGNAFHLYRHMLATRSEIDHVWLVADPGSRRRIEADLHRYEGIGGVDAAVRVVDRHSWRGYWAWLHSGCTFHTHGAYPMTRRARSRQIVSLWHGMPIKVIGVLNPKPHPWPAFGTLHVATSAMYRCVIAAAFRARIDDVVVAGLPRSDVLTQPSPLAPDAGSVKGAVGIPPAHRLVLWMPTYRSEGAEASGRATPHNFIDDVAEDRWRRIDELAARHRTTVLVKLHPFDPLNREVRQPGSTNIRILGSDEFVDSGVELYDLLAVSDGVISDVSSVMIDYLVTDRPIGIIGFDPGTYHRDVVFPVRALQQSARIHDLDDDEALADFFARVEGGVAGTVRDDLSLWLNDAPPGLGCEGVLAAAGF